MELLKVSSYDNGSYYTVPEHDGYHTYIDLDQNQYNYDIINENAQSFYENVFHHVGTVIGTGYTFESSYGKESSWDSLSQPEEMDKSLEDVSKLSTDGWRHKHVQTWTSFDIMNWVIHEIKRHGHNYENASMKTYGMTGDTLCNMSRADFVHTDPNFGGMLYESLQCLKNSQLPYNPVSAPTLPSFGNLRLTDDMIQSGESVITCLHSKKTYPICSDAESETSQVGLSMKQKPPNRPGRPTKTKRTKPEKKTGRLWEFIRDLLKNREYCPSLICWENYEEGVFRFVRSDKVAELWGTIKENPRMTYEKLSRAMRNYYTTGILEPVPKNGQYPKRLVYKFGHAAIWKTPRDYGNGSDRVLLQEQGPPACSGKAAGVQIWSYSNRLAHSQPKF